MKAQEIIGGQASGDRDQMLIDFLANGQTGFNPVAHWRLFAEWAPYYEDGNGEIVRRLETLSGKDISAEDYADETNNIMDISPLLYYRLPIKIRRSFESVISQEDLSGNSHKAFSLLSDKKLPSDTLLVHFTNHPDAIVQNGFRVGIPDMHLLGETVRLPAWMKTKPGYNFAYQHSRQNYGIQDGAWKRRYAVLFRHTGVLVQHYGDREEQVIFWGPYVKTSSIIGAYDADDTALFR